MPMGRFLLILKHRRQLLQSGTCQAPSTHGFIVDLNTNLTWVRALHDPLHSELC